jgi:hypothetical protein
MTDEQRKAALRKVDAVCKALDAYTETRAEKDNPTNRLESMNAALDAVGYFDLAEVVEAAKAFTATSDQVAVASAVGDDYDAYHTARKAHLEAHHALFDAVAALTKVQP